MHFLCYLTASIALTSIFALALSLIGQEFISCGIGDMKDFARQLNQLIERAENG